MSERPPLTPTISVADFRAFYWLKEELIHFCRMHGLSTVGSKHNLAERIATFLSTGHVPPDLPAAARSASARMPKTFGRETIIGPNWRCTEPLRVFFLAEIGPRFHFNSVMRDFIKHGAGKTLQQAITAWEASMEQSHSDTDIASQFEYNRHMRDFFKAHPAATRQAAIRAWNEKKAQRQSE